MSRQTLFRRGGGSDKGVLFVLQRKVRLGGSLPMTRERVARLVTVSNRFASHVMLEREGSSVNGKSMLGLLSISPMSGREFMLVTSGEDEREALEQISALLEGDGAVK